MLFFFSFPDVYIIHVYTILADSVYIHACTLAIALVKIHTGKRTVC